MIAAALKVGAAATDHLREHVGTAATRGAARGTAGRVRSREGGCVVTASVRSQGAPWTHGGARADGGEMAMEDSGRDAGRDAGRDGRRWVEATHAAFVQSPLPQAIVDLDGRFVEVNPAWADLFDQAAEELVGLPVDALVVARDLEGRDGRAPQELLRDSEMGTFDVVGRRADGRPLSLLVDARVLRDHDGHRFAVAVIARDVTEVQRARRRLAAQEGLFRALSRRSADSAVVMDADGNVVFVSPAVTDTFGHSKSDLLLATYDDLLHPDDLPPVRQVLTETLTRPEATERVTGRVRDAVGDWRWVEQTVTNCLADPDIGGVVVNLRDITAQVEAETAMRESEARYRAIVETAQEGILVTAPDGTTILANEVLATILGITVPEAYSRQLADTLGVARDGGAAAEPGQQQRSEIAYAHPDGSERLLSLTSTPLRTGDGGIGTLTMVSDVTAARHAEEELRRRALHDSLTGLPNRYLLGDRLAMAAARLERLEGGRMAVLFLDLDGFKLVNDTHGHEVGDQLLQQVADRLARSVRGGDTVARLGGDEFAVICEDADEGVALRVAGRVHRALREPVVIDETSFSVAASIGVAVSPPLVPGELLRRADVAMYRAKEAGGSVTAVFDGPTEELAR